MKTLFDQTQSGQMSLKNRFIRAAIGEKTSNGHVNENILKLYKRLAQGGTGTLITGFTLVDEAEAQFPMLAFYNDSFHQDHKILTNLVHEYNANIILQLVYVGSYVMGKVAGMTILAPSVVKNLNTKIIPQEITVEQIKNIQQKFSQAALRAKNAGYDGIEIHAAHGFLLSQFMTPHYNLRTDLYGGSTQNRARMSLETYDGFKDEVSFEDVLYLCKELTERKIDAIEISGAWNKFAPESTSFFKKEAERIAAENETKIIMTGGNKDFKEMTEILNSTKIEYFGMARALMKEPELVNRFEKEWI
jgi:2,4-dienoyl-CoA reductase-like NADH-dependent reductase (Old Yellow Enzyme family)